MNESEMVAMAEKIKSGTATEEERMAFFNNFEAFLKDINKELNEEA